MDQSTGEAVRPDTDCAIEFEEHVSGTNQPELVHRVELDRLSILQIFGPPIREIL